MPAAASALRPRAPPFIEPSGYAQHRPESTLLYQLVEQNYPLFGELRAREGRSLPDYVQKEFDAYLKCLIMLVARFTAPQGRFSTNC